MWPRIVEFMLGAWLVISPFVFRLRQDQTLLWSTDLVCGALVGFLALASYHPRWSRAHLGQLAVALWLVGTAFTAGSTPPPPPYQNHVVIGLLLVMFGVVPSRCASPPAGWQEISQRHS